MLSAAIWACLRLASSISSPSRTAALRDKDAWIRLAAATSLQRLRPGSKEVVPVLLELSKDDDGAIFHTYSSYARAGENYLGTYQLLDITPKGRNETGVWMRRHDEYNKR